MGKHQKPLGVQLAHALGARGVDTVFGIPGVHNIELYRGLEVAGVRHVLARHEQGAGFMADGYARATGRPGVAFVITGPGLCNIMTPMGQASSDDVPMLVISSCLEREHLGKKRGRLHEMRDQEGAAATVCEWSATATDSAAAFDLIDKAFAEFAASHRGARHIQVPIDVLGAPSDAAPAPPNLPRPLVAPQTDILQVAGMLDKATRPLFIFGGGTTQGFEAARDLMEKTGAACFTTYAGRGVIAPDHPLNFGATLARGGSLDIVASADLVVALGTRLAEVDLWRDALGHKAPLVRVDLDPASLSDWHHADLPVMGDAGPFMRALVDTLDPHPKSTWRADEIARARQRFLAETDAERPGILAVLQALQGALPANTCYFSDMTQIAYVANEVCTIAQPGLWHHPSGFGTLGYALPAAIGAKVAVGNAPVVAIAGDYGFQYTMQELGVAVELGLSLPIILWDNGKLGEIEDSMMRAGMAPNAVTARNPDFCALARAFGARACTPQTLDEMQKDVTAALVAPVPTLIHLTPGLKGGESS